MQHPYPEAVQSWCRQRRALQLEGALPPGRVQYTPSGVEPYIDDLNGRTLLDEIPGEPYLGYITIGAEQTAAIGVRPAPDTSRLAARCRIAIKAMRDLGWLVGDHKTMCGNGMILLGAVLDARHRVVRCPEVERRWMLHAVERLREGLLTSVSVDAPLLGRVTGRATNLSQFSRSSACR